MNKDKYEQELLDRLEWHVRSMASVVWRLHTVCGWEPNDILAQQMKYQAMAEKDCEAGKL